MRRAALTRRQELRRRHPGASAAAPGLRAASSRAFRQAVLAKGGCVQCGATTRLHAHHIVRAQTMKRHGLRDLVYHPLAGIPLCETCHARHHAWARRVPRTLIPAESIEFLTGLGLEADLDREYPPEREAA